MIIIVNATSFASIIIDTTPTITRTDSVTMIKTENISVDAGERIVCRMDRVCFLIWFCSLPSPPNLVHHALYVEMFRDFFLLFPFSFFFSFCLTWFLFNFPFISFSGTKLSKSSRQRNVSLASWQRTSRISKANSSCLLYL